MMESTERSRTTGGARNNVIAATGKRATLPCRAHLDKSNYFLEWKKEDIGTIYTYYFGTDRGQPSVGFEGLSVA